MPRLQDRYRNEIVPALMKEFSYSSVMSVPRIEKVTLNIGMGEALQNAKALDAATGDLTIIAGQKPVITKAKKSIANFKLREGNSIGVMVTLRGERMWSFLDRLMNIALPSPARLSRCFAGFVRWPWQLQPGFAGAARLARDPVRQDRQGPWHGGDDHHHGARRTRKAGGCLQLLGMPFRQGRR